jgi:uncharacterized protein involved in exopolysaccharide biosynthesis
MLIVSTVDILAERVAAAVDLIERLRSRVHSLEQEVAALRGRSRSADNGDGELARLRAERVVIRERVRGLLREIDKIAQ